MGILLLDLHCFVCFPYSFQLFGNVLFSLLLSHVSTEQESSECRHDNTKTKTTSLKSTSNLKHAELYDHNYCVYLSYNYWRPHPPSGMTIPLDAGLGLVFLLPNLLTNHSLLSSEDVRTSRSQISQIRADLHTLLKHFLLRPLLLHLFLLTLHPARVQQT